MKIYTITKKNFLRWYFGSGDADDGRLIDKLGELAYQQLLKNNMALITTLDVFNDSNHSAIRCYLLEEFEYNTDLFNDELGDVEKRDFEVKLI